MGIGRELREPARRLLCFDMDGAEKGEGVMLRIEILQLRATKTPELDALVDEFKRSIEREEVSEPLRCCPCRVVEGLIIMRGMK